MVVFCCSDTKGCKYTEVWGPPCRMVQSQHPNGGGVSVLGDHHVLPRFSRGAPLRGSDPLGVTAGAFAGSQGEHLILQTGRLRPVGGRGAWACAVTDAGARPGPPRIQNVLSSVSVCHSAADHWKLKWICQNYSERHGIFI